MQTRLAYKILRDAIFMKGSIARSARYRNGGLNFEILGRPEWSDVVDECMASLPDGYANVLSMRCEGLTNVQIGERLGKSTSYAGKIERKALMLLSSDPLVFKIGNAIGYKYKEGKWYD